MSSNELLTKGQEHPKIAELTQIIKREQENNKKLKMIVFTQFRETATGISKKLNELKGIKSKVFVGQAKKSQTGLSQKEQKKIIKEFSKGKINILCATCIAEEGLDIPEVNAVIFYEPIPSAIRTIQRTGRTARLEKGKLIILITKKTRDEAFYYVSRSREKKMHSIIDKVKQDLAKGKTFSSQKTLF
jgi:Fanconi anemia group M protein